MKYDIKKSFTELIILLEEARDQLCRIESLEKEVNYLSNLVTEKNNCIKAIDAKLKSISVFNMMSEEIQKQSVPFHKSEDDGA